MTNRIRTPRVTLRRIAASIVLAADALAGAITKQFPDKAS